MAAAFSGTFSLGPQIQRGAGAAHLGAAQVLQHRGVEADGLHFGLGSC